MASSPSPAKLRLAPILMCLPLLASACVFGGDSEEEPDPTATALSRPAISRSGPESTPAPTRTPFVPPTRVPPTPGAARNPVEGLVSVVYSFPFVWPAAGPITSFMSPEHPNGIDIGLDDGDSLEVRAAAGGTVTFAGGDDDELLGISIVIDHGNGVTTTYGHLSELSVAEGDEVVIGQPIGIGGSTGMSTGNHLHLEVRRNGETVDPLHVLPVEDGDTTSVEIDCATTPFTLPVGAQALLDFTGVLDDGEELVSVNAVPLNEGPALVSTVESPNEVRITSAIDFEGPTALDSYDLEITVNGGADDDVLSCGFVVQRDEVPTTFYVRADPPANGVDGDAEGEGEPAAEAETPAPTPTATPNPWSGTPNYGATPAGSGGSQPPAASPPAGSAGGAQTPNYGIPTGNPSATPAP